MFNEVTPVEYVSLATRAPFSATRFVIVALPIVMIALMIF